MEFKHLLIYWNLKHKIPVEKKLSIVKYNQCTELEKEEEQEQESLIDLCTDNKLIHDGFKIADELPLEAAIYITLGMFWNCLKRLLVRIDKNLVLRILPLTKNKSNLIIPHHQRMEY